MISFHDDMIIILNESDHIKNSPPYWVGACISASYKIDSKQIANAILIILHRDNDDSYEVVKGRRGESYPCYLPKKNLTKMLLKI